MSHVVRACAVLGASLYLSGCLFPVVDFEGEGHSTQLRRATHPSALARAVHSQPPTPKLSPTAQDDQRASRNGGSAPLLAMAGTGAGAVAGAGLSALRPSHERACHQTLAREAVAFNHVEKKTAPGVRWPVRLDGPIHGVRFNSMDASTTYTILDCRLAVALSAWASSLARAGVQRVEYFSMYRPHARIAGSGSVSGHAHGLAIDAARFHLSSGAVLDVLPDWEEKTRGQAPCPVRRAEARGARILRSIACSVVDQKLFQVVLTPHYNRAHNNHLHLELKPEVTWTYVR